MWAAVPLSAIAIAPQRDDGIVGRTVESEMPRSTDPCRACGGGDDEGLVLLCDECHTPYHAHCVGFKGPLLGDWFCKGCKRRRRREAWKRSEECE